MAKRLVIRILLITACLPLKGEARAVLKIIRELAANRTEAVSIALKNHLLKA